MNGDWNWMNLEAWVLEMWNSVTEQVLSASMLVQVGGLVVALLLAMLAVPRLRAGMRKLPQVQWMPVRQELLSNGAAALLFPVILWLFIWIALAVTSRAGWSVALPRSVLSLLAAWIVIRFTTLFVKDPAWARLVFLTAWTLAALSILGLLEPTIALLDQLAIRVGNLRVSALLILQGLLSLVVFLWLAVTVSQMMENRIRSVSTLTPSIQVLVSKLLKILLITVAIVGALGIIGVDVTAFAVFTGAVGVGVGFGLQKVVSNLISGVILLLDRSVKPGDVISVGDTFGWINSLGARYVSVITRDGREYLIPNEDLITQQVVNWSYSNSEVRLNIPIGVSYRSDVHKAMQLCLDAANLTPRVLAKPSSQCLLRGFGDSSVDLELRFWINDPQNGIANLQSDVLLRVWDLFHANGIEIPFPQRDLHLVSPAKLSVSLSTSAQDGAEKAPLRESGPGA